jgi:hypothetical protein
MTLSATRPIELTLHGGLADMRRLALMVVLLLACNPARAMVGDTEDLSDARSRPEVMILGTGKNLCSAVAIAPNLLLTAAHCIMPGDTYKRVEIDPEGRPVFKPSAAVMQHPQFNIKSYLAHRVAADVGLVKLKEPMAAPPVPLAGPRQRIAPGESFLVHGYGRSVRDDRNSAATLRAARLIATGQPGALQLRLVDPATGNKRPGLGACDGDSGAPVYQDNAGRVEIVGVVSWSTAANNEAGCGGLTGVTPIELYRGWIVETARKMGIELPR